ncbi:MAG: mandelate racemase/muconate lactonizing enzyme family protein [Pelagibacteraceae bacterium]|jgi:2-dehydro-3-deoxyphosphogalactonate aldolase|nr:mandelate racemase/muconate lactonizing enzyme family protein [Pelagibacteraceae bacterium]MDP6785047.1 mandelate racemase/muconate lactonizing enzyme family protein [Alphaproteobacteria bacterium]MBO6466753.1 mandelate racemase/muconate lactonizing enzyme family protein [Pelagibacteraceae bacterium]MBO6468455.1 mandelate racemase/muconate lactonizing enzyme family protein [Pelagibacteraceae bacterium]MBO6470456.1 mandelate racemase/muconate lactonizing enzyme family protein [Pelagibacterace|tara:strand:+ start:2058 stop:3245 length:1188 start_codon:yes stop_codon:yes gene_type:complete
MKIKKVETFIVGNPPPHYGGRYFILIKVTSNNIIGWGECYAPPFHPRVVKKMIQDVSERFVIGSDPYKIENLFRNVYSTGYNQRPDISLMGILSGLEIACWDIIGKDLNKPVYELLGGQVREKLRSYTYLYPRNTDKKNVYKDPDLAAERALEYAEEGFTAVKFDPVGPYTIYDPRQLSLSALSLSEQFVSKIRKAVGYKCDILFGTHGQMTSSSAVRLAKKIEPYDPLWFEEPVPPDNIDAMALVALKTSIPIATGERLSTKYEFSKVIEKKAASIIQFNLGRVGGILEAKKISAIAEANGIQIAPHLYCGPIVAAANIQIATCVPNFLILECIYKLDGFYAEILKKPIQWKDGFVIPSKEPGLGLEIDEKIINKYPYEEKELHLQASNKIIDF